MSHTKSGCNQREAAAEAGAIEVYVYIYIYIYMYICIYYSPIVNCWPVC